MKNVKLKTKKFKPRSVIYIILNVAFLAILIYDAWILKTIYQKLHQEPPYQAITRIVRVNNKELDKALERYSASANYTVGEGSIPDPF